MKVTNVKSSDNWQEVKNSCMTTINKTMGKYPDSKWKKNILLCEHSPIRRLRISWKWVDLPYWISVHMVRHHIGISHFVGTQRTDDNKRENAPQSAPVIHSCEANAQALINISRKRLCNKAAAETRQAWQAVKDGIVKIEPELASCMVRECVYRGFCPELHSCEFCETELFQDERERYIEV